MNEELRALAETARALAEGPGDPWTALESAGLTLISIPERAGGSGGDRRHASAVLRATATAGLPLAETLVAATALSEAGLPIPPGPLTYVLTAPIAHPTAPTWTLTGRAPAVPWASTAGLVVITPTAIALIPAGTATTKPPATPTNNPHNDLTNTTAPADALEPPDDVTRDGVPRGGEPHGGVTHDGVPRGGVTRGGVTRGGVTRGGEPRDGVTHDGVTRGGGTRDGMAGVVAVEGGVNFAGEPRGDVVFDGFVLGAESVAGVSAAFVERVREHAALARAEVMVGALELAVGLAVRHAAQRVQFGRTLDRFQAVQALLAEAAGETRAAAAGVDAALLPGAGGAAVAVAKIQAGRAAGVVARATHQVLGALGFTEEHALRHATLRLWAWRDEDGSEAHWARILGGTIAARPEALWPVLTGLSPLPGVNEEI